MTTPIQEPADLDKVASLARRHGLEPSGPIELNELGLDFQVGFLTDRGGVHWVLRIPRRADVLPRLENERRVLAFVNGKIPVLVPDWKIVSNELIAYPRLEGKLGVTVDAQTHKPTWNFDKSSSRFQASLGQTLAALHGLDSAEAASAGLKVLSPGGVRQRFADQLDQVKRELNIGESLDRRWRTWLDDDEAWPPHTTLVHGDLHVGHVLIDETARATGILDWTEAEVSDPSIDLIFHLMGFGPEGLDQLLLEYENAGGHTWPGLRRQVEERLAAFPIQHALFAIQSGNAELIEAAKTQLTAAGDPESS